MKKFKFTAQEKFILKLVAIVVVGLLIRAYGLYIQRITIESATLVSVNENTHQSYIISFDGKEHIYSGDWKEEYKAD